jgi:hypothetical protein
MKADHNAKGIRPHIRHVQYVQGEIGDELKVLTELGETAALCASRDSTRHMVNIPTVLTRQTETEERLGELIHGKAIFRSELDENH